MIEFELKSCVLYAKNAIKATANTIGKGDGTPLQYSCLENPMDGGAW